VEAPRLERSIPLAPSPPPSVAISQAPRPSSAESKTAQARDVEKDLDEVVATGLEAQREVQRSAPRGTIESGEPADASSASSAEVSSADEWLERIRKLRGSGQTSEADKQWRAFRQKYPDHEVARDDVARGREGT
jgi:hypothetical protein